MLLTPNQRKLLNTHFQGLPAHGVLNKAIKTNLELVPLRPLLKTGLNLEDVAIRNGLKRVLKRTTDVRVWESKHAKQALREFYAELCTKHQTLLSNSALLSQIKDSKVLEFDHYLIEIKASTLAERLKQVFWPESTKGDYGHIAVLQRELLSENKIVLKGFDYQQQFDLDNLRALGRAIKQNPPLWSIKNTINYEPLLTQMIIAARMMTIFVTFPSHREIVECNDPLISTVALNYREYFRNETKLCEVLPVSSDARLSFSGKHGLKRLEVFFIELCKDRTQMVNLSLIDVLSKDYCSATIKRAVESHGFANITEYQAHLFARGKLNFTHKANQGALRLDATKNGTAGEVLIGQLLQSTSVEKKLKNYGVPVTVESQCYVPSLNRRVDFVLGGRMIVEVMMVKTEHMFGDKGIATSRRKEATYIDGSKAYYQALSASDIPHLIIGAENTIRTRRDAANQQILDAIDLYFNRSTLSSILAYEPTYQTACNYDLVGLTGWLKDTLFYHSGSRLLPSRSELAAITLPKWESAIVMMTHLGTGQVCQSANLSFESHLSRMDNLDLSDGTVRRTILEKHFGHLKYLPKIGCWSSSLNPLKTFYQAQGLNLAEEDAKKIWVQLQKAPRGHYESDGELNLYNIATAIRELKPFKMGSCVFPTKYQFELESLSGAYGPMQKALASKDTQTQLSELTGLMTIEQYVKKAMTIAQANLEQAGFIVSKKKASALTKHFQRQAQLEWKILPAHRYSRFF